MVDTVLELAVPARLPQVGALRRAADAFLRQTVPDQVRQEVLLVISELCTNAVEAMHNPGAELTMRVRDTDDRTVVEVEDMGPGFTASITRGLAGDDDERGRGLHVVQSIVDELMVDRAYGRTTVRCSIRKAA